MAVGEASADGLLQALAKVPDSRDPRGVRYRLATLLAIGVCDDGGHGRMWDAFATVDPGALTAEGFARLTALASPAVGPLSPDGVPEREQRRAHRATALAPDSGSGGGRSPYSGGMANREGVRVDLDGILPQLEANGFDDVRVEFAPDDGGAAAVLDVVRQGVGAANEAAAEHAWGAWLTASLAGVSVKLTQLESREALVGWLEAFGGEVRAGGLSGELRATAVVRLPVWFSQIADPMVTAYVALAAPGDAGAADWAERAVRWAAEAGGDAYVSSGGMNQLDATGDVAAHLAAALHVASSGALLYADAQASRAAFVQIGANGQATYQIHDASASLAAQANRARAAILAEAEHAHYAFVAPTPHQAYSWDDRGRALPPLRPEISAAALRENADLWSRFVPDVHCMQLLTDEHLALVSDLSRWAVTPVTPGRTLVEAPDLAEWLRPGGPAHSVLDHARADFGRALAFADDVR